MNISINFNRFIFGVVLRDLRKIDVVLKFERPMFKFRPAGITKESFRELLKHLDFNYPRDDKGVPISYTMLTTEQMSNHIRWIELTAANSGVTLDYIEDEWKIIMAKCH